MRGGVGHAPAAAGRTEAPALAGERDQPVLAAVVAVHAEESAGQDAAVEELTQLALDEARDDAIASRLGDEERLELPGQDTVQNGRFGTPRLIGSGRGARHSPLDCDRRAGSARTGSRRIDANVWVE